MSLKSMKVCLRRQQFTAASAAGGSLSPLQALPAAVPAPCNRKSLYTCHTCNVKGHWKGDEKCRLEDVPAHLAPLIHQAAAREILVPGTSVSGPELIFMCPFHTMFLCPFLGA